MNGERRRKRKKKRKKRQNTQQSKQPELQLLHAGQRQDIQQRNQQQQPDQQPQKRPQQKQQRHIRRATETAGFMTIAITSSLWLSISLDFKKTGTGPKFALRIIEKF